MCIRVIRRLVARHVMSAVLMTIVAFVPRAARAGLVIEIGRAGPPNLDVQVVRGGLTFTSGAARRTIPLPGNLAQELVDWANADRGGPIVISMDGSLVPGVTNAYTPPAMSPDLADSMLDYDDYAHMLACGAVPVTGAHPWIAAHGDDRGMPNRRYEELLRFENTSDEASWYRRLASRYVAPPQCIGELTLRARATSTPVLVDVSVDSWTHQRTSQWYRSVDVPTEWDRWAAQLPYRYLKEHIENHWQDYRAAFSPMDDLTSVVEAMALLRWIRQAAPDRISRVARLSEFQLPAGEVRAAPRLRGKPLDVDSWRAVSAATLRGGVRTSAEADIALALLCTAGSDGSCSDVGPGGLADNAAWADITRVAAGDARLNAKVQLASLLGAVAERVTLRDIEQTLAVLRGRYPNAFRLRAAALSLVESTYWSVRGAVPIFREESRALVNELTERVGARCNSAAASDDLEFWESRSQDVYSVGLLQRAKSYNVKSDAFMAAVGCIHYRRALAPQVGRELAYQHAHFRFLGYLRATVWSPELRARFAQYQRAIAQRMNLPFEEEVAG